MANVLFNISGDREKLPTLREWLKQIGKRKIANVYPIMCVWKPGKYSTVVFETESFRAIVYKGNPGYTELVDQLDELVYADHGLGISVNRDEPGRFSIVTLDNERPDVSAIDGYGYRFSYQ